VPAGPAAGLADTGSDLLGPILGGGGLLLAGLIAFVATAIIRRRGNGTASPDKP